MTSGLLNKTKLKKVRKVDRYQTENKFITKYQNIIIMNIYSPNKNTQINIEMINSSSK